MEDFGTGAVETDHVVPAVADGQAVGPAVAAATEVDRDRSILVRGGADVVTL